MDNTNNSCCCGETEHFSGCLICGAPVTYSVESSVKTCSICHKEQLTNAVCENGHFVCDACHSYGTYIPVSTALRSSTEKDPLLLLEEIIERNISKLFLNYNVDADKLESIEDSLEESLVEIQSLFEKSDKLDLPED